MKKKIFVLAISLAALLFSSTSCDEDNFFADKEKFADLNSNPSVVSEPDVRFLISRAMQQMYNNNYTIWFYTYNDYVFPFSQVTTSTQSGNNTTFNEGGLTGLHNLYAALVPAVDARKRIENLDADKKASSQAMKALTYPIQIYTAMVNMDYIGGFPYSEAGLAAYTNPPLLTPKVDTEQELLTLWVTELDEAIKSLSLPNQFSIGNQDLFYKGDYTKWVKFCNLLKLRIAARLVNANRAKAIEIAQQVGASQYMDNLNDDLLYNGGVAYFGTGNSVGDAWLGFAGQNLVEFLKTNRDPRLRFMFRKNDFNPEVIDAMIATNGFNSLPTKIKEIVNLNAEGKFDSWKAGFEEPWGRYWGVPVSTDATSNVEYFQQSNRYFATNANGSGRKTYTWSSVLEEKNQRTALSYTYPTKPGGAVYQVKGSEVPLYVLLGSAAETNLYLAEFKLLGANLPKSANEYFQNGVKLSVERMDKLAQAHSIPYYNEDPVLKVPADGATKLKSTEIAALLTKSAYKLDGTNDLEKVYIQQYVHFINTPGDLWTTVRRSGIPKKNSTYLAWEEFGVSNIPRRVLINAPEESDLDYESWKTYFTAAGFTTGDNSPTILGTERLWFDKNNPNYGAGPK